MICLAGLIHIAWIRGCACRAPESKTTDTTPSKIVVPLDCEENREASKDLAQWTAAAAAAAIPSQLGGRTLFTRKCRSCVVRIHVGKRSAQTFCDHVDKNGFQGHLKRSLVDYGPVDMRQGHCAIPLVSDFRADLRMAIALACCLLTFTLPPDIEWLWVHKLRHTANTNFVKNYQLLKFAELVKQLMEGWYLLGWVLFMPLMFLSNPVVRAQFLKLYCHRVRCKRRHCRLCYCGYYCDTDMNESNCDGSGADLF
ncbi:unnamed protein product [Echinostoma caproni]|uniref:DDE_Tnp_1_7 domain-containing protein n=1 Tax=Echinostoma caproni TaxID=27848 RepID=A0A183AMY3_9TREM|nr:unnamed protein product [Echinostoma caproni]